MTSIIPRYFVGELLAEAAQWRLLGLLFACPRGDWHEQVAALAAEVQDAALQRAARLAVEGASEAAYHTAFGPGGPAAPREVSHRPAVLTGQYLAELLAYYEVFAYCPRRDEPPDHIATEIDFIAYLRLKQAFVAARNDDTQADRTAEAARCFIHDHLAIIAVPLAQLLESSGIHYFSLAAAALAERIHAYGITSGFSLPQLDQELNSARPGCETGGCCAELSD